MTPAICDIFDAYVLCAASSLGKKLQKNGGKCKKSERNGKIGDFTSRY